MLRQIEVFLPSADQMIEAQIVGRRNLAGLLPFELIDQPESWSIQRES
jgi:hypothetical protein